MTPAASAARMRPLRPVPTLLGVAAVLAIWWLVGHNSGSGWVQVIGECLAASLIVGVVGPALALRLCRVAVTTAPGDATAGLPVTIAVTASARVRVRPIEPPGPEVFVGPIRRHSGDSSDQLTLLPVRRGVHRALVVDVATAAPFALLWWSRRVTLALPAELLVAPRLGPAKVASSVDDDTTGDGRPRTGAPVGEPRGVRPYRVGDARRSVHWRATAHVGMLMVREAEAPTAEPVTITVELPPDPEAAERLAEQALGTVTRLLDQGTPVILVTQEINRTVAAAVEDRHHAGRRLARAIPAAGGQAAPA